MKKWRLGVLALSALWGCRPVVPQKAPMPPAVGPQSEVDPRCAAAEHRRGYKDQGTDLFGLRNRVPSRRGAPGAPSRGEEPRRIEVFHHLQRTGVKSPSGVVQEVDVAQGRLFARGRGGEALPPEALIGATLTGVAVDGSTVEVVVCKVEPYPDAPGVLGYQVLYQDPEGGGWASACPGTVVQPSTLALPLAGTWDESGGHHESATAFTLACAATGVLAKCVEWGYRPWQSRGGVSLAPYHQACTRMARADYCGTGRSHTADISTIDIYDALHVQTRAQGGSAGVNAERMVFEAAWTPDGAYCLARTRYQEPLKTILDECPDRFVQEPEDLGHGDVCAVRRKSGTNRAASAVDLRNRTF